MKNPSLLHVTRVELGQKRVLLISIGISLLYLLFALSLPNIGILHTTLTGRYSISYKYALTTGLIQGDYLQLHPFDRMLLLITAILVGCNIALFLSTVQRLKKQGSLSVSVGGGTILGVLVTGCSSCGISLLSLFGVTASFGLLPFGDISLRLISLLLLSGSIFYMLKKLREDVYCKLPQTKKVTQ